MTTEDMVVDQLGGFDNPLIEATIAGSGGMFGASRNGGALDRPDSLRALRATSSCVAPTSLFARAKTVE